ATCGAPGASAGQMAGGSGSAAARTSPGAGDGGGVAGDRDAVLRTVGVGAVGRTTPTPGARVASTVLDVRCAPARWPLASGPAKVREARSGVVESVWAPVGDRPETASEGSAGGAPGACGERDRERTRLASRMTVRGAASRGSSGTAGGRSSGSASDTPGAGVRASVAGVSVTSTAADVWGTSGAADDAPPVGSVASGTAGGSSASEPGASG